MFFNILVLVLEALIALTLGSTFFNLFSASVIPNFIFLGAQFISFGVALVFTYTVLFQILFKKQKVIKTEKGKEEYLDVWRINAMPYAIVLLVSILGTLFSLFITDLNAGGIIFMDQAQWAVYGQLIFNVLWFVALVGASNDEELITENVNFLSKEDAIIDKVDLSGLSEDDKDKIKKDLKNLRL